MGKTLTTPPRMGYEYHALLKMVLAYQRKVGGEERLEGHLP